MSRRTNRPTYQVTAFAVACIVLMGLAARQFRPLIPLPDTNELAGQFGDFYTQAERQVIPWQPLRPDVFSRARREDKPIFLVLGTSWSRLARMVDSVVFLENDVVEQLKQRFICVRLDLTQRPHMLGAYLPLSRIAAPVDSAFQIVILDQQGSFVRGLFRVASDSIDSAALLEFVRGAIKELSHPEARSRSTQAQTQEVAALLQTMQAEPLNIDRHVRQLRARLNRTYGGLCRLDVQELDPNGLRFLLANADSVTLQAALAPVLHSSLVDWLDGGFFKLSGRADFKLVHFDKIAVQNAAMLAAVAHAYAANPTPELREVVVRTYDWLSGQLAETGLLRTAQIGATAPMNRSERYSFPVSLLRNAFAQTDRQWLRSNFHLRVEENPQMLIRVTEPLETLSAAGRAAQMLGRLRDLKKGEPPRWTPGSSLDVNGYCLARMMEASRLLGDHNRATLAAAKFESLRAFRSGINDVIHSKEKAGVAYACLADYLSYVDAAMQAYLTLGNPLVLEDGEIVLRRAIELFDAGVPGVLYAGPAEDPDLGLRDVRSPQISDEFSESTSAMSIRLALQFAALQHRSPEPEPRLRDWAEAGIRHFAPIVNRLDGLLSGLFLAGDSATRPFALTVGPTAIEDAHKLARLAPSSWVAPLHDSIDADVAPGVYVVSRGERSGPYSVDESAARLKP